METGPESKGSDAIGGGCGRPPANKTSRMRDRLARRDSAVESTSDVCPMVGGQRFQN
jgi:hypothetical protein